MNIFKKLFSSSKEIPQQRDEKYSFVNEFIESVTDEGAYEYVDEISPLCVEILEKFSYLNAEADGFKKDPEHYWLETERALKKFNGKEYDED